MYGKHDEQNQLQTQTNETFCSKLWFSELEKNRVSVTESWTLGEYDLIGRNKTFGADEKVTNIQMGAGEDGNRYLSRGEPCARRSRPRTLRTRRSLPNNANAISAAQPDPTPIANATHCPIAYRPSPRTSHTAQVQDTIHSD